MKKNYNRNDDWEDGYTFEDFREQADSDAIQEQVDSDGMKSSEAGFMSGYFTDLEESYSEDEDDIS